MGSRQAGYANVVWIPVGSPAIGKVKAAWTLRIAHQGTGSAGRSNQAVTQQAEHADHQHSQDPEQPHGQQRAHLLHMPLISYFVPRSLNPPLVRGEPYVQVIPVEGETDMTADRWLVIVGWVLLVLMAWQTVVSIYEASVPRTLVGVTAITMAFWALGVNRDRYRDRTRRPSDREDAQTRRG